VRELFNASVRITGINNLGNIQDAKQAGAKSAQEATISRGLSSTQQKGNLLK
jgi:hypothetical protein